MKKKSAYFAYSIFLLALFQSCSPKDCITKSGEKTSITRTVPAFRSIEINDIFTINLVNGNAQEIEIKAGEKILPHIKTEVKDSILYLSNSISCRFVRGFGNFPELTVSIPKDLKSIVTNTASDLYTPDTLKIKHLLFKFIAPISSANLTIKSQFIAFELWNKSTGDFQIAGKTKYLSLLNDGLTTIDARKCIGDYVKVSSFSATNTYLTANKKLEVKIFGEGNVIYNGTVEDIKLDAFSSGQLLKEHK